MVVGILKVSIYIQNNHSLKEKRKVVKSVVAKVQQKFNVSIAEVGNYDLWQSSQVGFCVVGNDKRFINSSLDKIIRFIEDLNSAEIVKSEIELLNF